jgi:hypothetical protein
VRTYRAQSGPFTEGLFLAKEEIERICTDELRKQDLFPNRPEPIRIDRFVEKRFVTPTYQDLGDGILGFTRFGSKGVQEIVINSKLDEENTISAGRRVRSTLAHEAGHGLLHTHLFVLSSTHNPLFAGGKDTPKVLCRDESDASSQKVYRGKWWEYQANRAIGSLLLPIYLAREVMDPFLEEAGQLGLKVLSQAKRAGAEKELSEVFDVNPVVARIRIEELYPEAKVAQGIL